MAHERLKKLLALAREGVGGEREKAARLLERLLKENGLTLADLEEKEQPQRQKRKFTVGTKQEATLLHQIAAQVLNMRRPPAYGRRMSPVYYELSDSEYIEMQLRWKIYRAAWKKEVDRLLVAFVNAQNIFPEDAQASSGSGPEMTDEEMKALLALMGGIAPVSVHKPLPGAN